MSQSITNDLTRLGRAPVHTYLHAHMYICMHTWTSIRMYVRALRTSRTSVCLKNIYKAQKRLKEDPLSINQLDVEGRSPLYLAVEVQDDDEDLLRQFLHSWAHA